MLAVALFLTTVVQVVVQAHNDYRMTSVSLNIRSSIMSAIYQKALRISNYAKKTSSTGEVVNLMAIDSQKMLDVAPHINYIWAAPLQIILTLYFLWKYLGLAVLSGLIFMIILIPVISFISSQQKKFQAKQMKNKDKRVMCINEVLSGMKVLKFYAWENSYEQKILKIRDEEIRIFRKNAYYTAAAQFIWHFTPFMVSFILDSF